MAQINPTDKPAFSFKEVVSIAGLVSGFLFQYFSLRTEVRDLKSEMKALVMEQSFNKREIIQQVTAAQKDIDDFKKYVPQLASLFSPADKPKPIKIQTEEP